MIKGKTDTGFEFNIDENVMDDWELLEDLSELDENSGKVISVSKRLLQDHYDELKEHCRNKENGRIAVTKMIEEIRSIFTYVKELKNL